MKNQIKISLQSLSENVGVARMAAVTFAAQGSFTLGEIDEIKVAVSEAVSNAVIHGYGEDQGFVDLAMNLFDDKVEFIVRDEGKGISDIAAAREPSFSTDPERMGLGFAFMESFMDSLEIESEAGKGTTVKMAKHFAAAAKQVS